MTTEQEKFFRSQSSYRQLDILTLASLQNNPVDYDKWLTILGAMYPEWDLDLVKATATELRKTPSTAEWRIGGIDLTGSEWKGEYGA